MLKDKEVRLMKAVKNTYIIIFIMIYMMTIKTQNLMIIEIITEVINDRKLINNNFYYYFK